MKPTARIAMLMRGQKGRIFIDQSEVVRYAAHHRKRRICQRTIERIAATSAVDLYGPDRRLDAAAPTDYRLQGCRDAPPLTRARDAHLLFHADAMHYGPL